MANGFGLMAFIFNALREELPFCAEFGIILVSLTKINCG
jgi:hypothetical protein